MSRQQRGRRQAVGRRLKIAARPRGCRSSVPRPRTPGRRFLSLTAPPPHTPPGKQPEKLRPWRVPRFLPFVGSQAVTSKTFLGSVLLTRCLWPPSLSNTRMVPRPLLCLVYLLAGPTLLCPPPGTLKAHSRCAMYASGVHMQLLESHFSLKLSSFVRTAREPSRFSQEQECFLSPKQIAQAHIKMGNRLRVYGSPQPRSLGRLPPFVSVALAPAGAAGHWHTDRGSPSRARGRHG